MAALHGASHGADRLVPMGHLRHCLATTGQPGARYRIKRAHTAELREQVYALRYRAYRREQAIAEFASGKFRDRYDDQPNHVLWALTDHDRVIGSIRSMWWDPTALGESTPELDNYADEISQLVSPDRLLFSGNRFVTDPPMPGHIGDIALTLLRCHMAVAEQKADYALAAVRANHLAFYRRVLALDPISEAKVFPGLTCKMVLTACNYGQSIASVYRRTPSIKPTGDERMLLDPAYQHDWETGIPVEGAGLLQCR